MYLHRIVLFIIILVCHFNYSAFANDSSENLNPAEKYVIEQVKKGQIADFSHKTEEDRILSADFLKKLLTGGFLHLKVPEKGIMIERARIKEKIDINKEKISFPVYLRCIFDKDISFSQTEFTGWATFFRTKFTGDSDFSETIFTGGTEFFETIFTGEASFSGAEFTGGASFPKAEFTGGAYFVEAKFTGDADFSEAKFPGMASFYRAEFTGEASFSGLDLSEADLSHANLSGVIFQPKKIPTIRNIAFAKNLSKMKYESSPQALTELREGFKNAGLRTQEREITYAIKYTQTTKLWSDLEYSLDDLGGLDPTTASLYKKQDRKFVLKDRIIWRKLESLFNLIFFELTCAYGMKPGRPLIILFFAIIPLFSIPYSFVLMRPPKRDGIWKAWISDRVRKDLGSEEPVRLNLGFFSALRYGFYFSLISAFSIGWRELNVGNWITRIQWREYTLRASGWVRMVSGFQSLVSVYLLAMWVLTYFGRPFEAV
jgi:uncharacterized protein YjbI with pentapeptide repeats